MDRESGVWTRSQRSADTGAGRGWARRSGVRSADSRSRPAERTWVSTAERLTWHVLHQRLAQRAEHGLVATVKYLVGAVPRVQRHAHGVRQTHHRLEQRLGRRL